MEYHETFCQSGGSSNLKEEQFPRQLVLNLEGAWAVFNHGNYSREWWLCIEVDWCGRAHLWGCKVWYHSDTCYRIVSASDDNNVSLWTHQVFPKSYYNCYMGRSDLIGPLQFSSVLKNHWAFLVRWKSQLGKHIITGSSGTKQTCFIGLMSSR